jgi:putative peptide zinc metalloprotease protein
VLHDAFNNQFFRLQPGAYEFVARLRPHRTVESVWQECVQAHPEDAPGQEDVIRLLAQLNASNLLHSNLPPDSEKIFERYRKRREQEARSRWMNIMYSRIPLLDPDAFLKSILPLLRRVISPVGAIVWLGVIIFGVRPCLRRGI